MRRALNEEEISLLLKAALYGEFHHSFTGVARYLIYRLGIEIINEVGESLDFHSLRHTCATRLARAGVSPKMEMSIMRHSYIDLTTKVYSHVTVKDKRKAVGVLPELNHG